MWTTSPANAATANARAADHRAPRASRTNAAMSSARYTASPTIPCSAATVTGIVCDADTARRLEASSWRRYSRANDADPWPSTGASPNRRSPPAMRSTRPLVARSAEADEPRSRCTAPGATITKATATTARAPATSAVWRALQRRAASTPSPASSAAKLDCENVTSSPPQSTASTTPPATASRVRARHSTAAVTASMTSARNRP